MPVTNLADARRVDAHIGYLLHSSTINRRFCAPHEDVNTSEYAEYAVNMRDGSGLEAAFDPDVHGFRLVDAPTDFTAWTDLDAIREVYEPAQLAFVQRLLGEGVAAALGVEGPAH